MFLLYNYIRIMASKLEACSKKAGLVTKQSMKSNPDRLSIATRKVSDK